MPGDLGDDVRGRAESVEAESLTGMDLAQAQRTKPDDAGTQERCGFLILEHGRDWVGERFPCDHIFRVAPVHVVPREPSLKTEVFSAACAELAASAGLEKPGQTSPVASTQGADLWTDAIHDAHDLMAGNDRVGRAGEVALYDVEIRPADGADPDTDPHLLRAGLRNRPVPHRKWTPGNVRDVFGYHSAHWVAQRSSTCCTVVLPGGAFSIDAAQPVLRRYPTTRPAGRGTPLLAEAHSGVE